MFIPCRIAGRFFRFVPFMLLIMRPVVSQGADPMINQYRVPVPSASEKILYEDLDHDGDPDVLRTKFPDGTPVQWIDDDDDMKKGDRGGDGDSDCLMIDRNRDGQYGGPEDLIIDMDDEDGDGRADLQVISENARLDQSDFGPGHFMIVIDTDHDGVFNYIDWKTYELKCWDHIGRSRFYTDYLGQSLFIKVHTATYNVPDLRFNWENPFLFYDPDHDGLTEMAIRLCDSNKMHPPLSKDFSFPKDGRISDDMRRIEFTKKIDWAGIPIDLDNDNGPGNEFDYDMTLQFLGPGFNYEDQVHHFKSLRGLPAADRFFYDPRWRQMTELIYPDHQSAWDLVFHRGQWKTVNFVFDEDDDCNRWERVELYQPRDPFTIGVNKGGLDNHPQADCSGDRGEFDLDNSGGGKLYVGRFDGRIHLYGAEWGAWRVDQDAHFFQGWSRSQDQPTSFPTVKYLDSNHNGFIDTIQYDMDGDRKFERTDSLLALGLDDRCKVLDTSRMTYPEFTALFKKVSAGMWENARQAMRLAERAGIDLNGYAALRQPRSQHEKYHCGYWLAYYIREDLRQLADRLGDRAYARKLDRAWYQGDWKSLAPPAKPAGMVSSGLRKS